MISRSRRSMKASFQSFMLRRKRKKKKVRSSTTKKYTKKYCFGMIVTTITGRPARKLKQP